MSDELADRADALADMAPLAVKVDTEGLLGRDAGEVAGYMQSILVDMRRHNGEAQVADRYDTFAEDPGGIRFDGSDLLRKDATRNDRVYLGTAGPEYVRGFADRFGDTREYGRVDVEPNGGPLGTRGGGI